MTTIHRDPEASASVVVASYKPTIRPRHRFGEASPSQSRRNHGAGLNPYRETADLALTPCSREQLRHGDL